MFPSLAPSQEELMKKMSRLAIKEIAALKKQEPRWREAIAKLREEMENPGQMPAPTVSSSSW
jgi:chaperonin cofactor prefoldin